MAAPSRSFAAADRSPAITSDRAARVAFATYTVMAYIVMAYKVIVFLVMAYTVMACTVMAHIVMADTVMAYKLWPMQL